MREIAIVTIRRDLTSMIAHTIFHEGNSPLMVDRMLSEPGAFSFREIPLNDARFAAYDYRGQVSAEKVTLSSTAMSLLDSVV